MYYLGGRRTPFWRICSYRGKDFLYKYHHMLNCSPIITDEIEKELAVYRYEHVISEIEHLQQQYCCIHVEYIGNSVMGKPIPAIRIGEGNIAIHVNGAIHANEWITSILLMQFINDYAHMYTIESMWDDWNAYEAFTNTTLWLVPMVNPDGVELVQTGITSVHPYYKSLIKWNENTEQFQRWKANIRGVDLNDQFPAYWEEEKERRQVDNPGPLNYGGAQPLSEPETIALVKLTEQIPFALALSFHTQGEEIYWNYRDYEPPESLNWAMRFAEVSGYKVVKLSDSDAGFKDWFIQQYRKPAFTIEVGRGVSPLPLTDFSNLYQAVASIIKEALTDRTT